LRRPIVFVMLSFIFGIAFQYYADIDDRLLYFTLAAFVAASIFIWRKASERQKNLERFLCLFFVIALLGSLYLQLTEDRKDPLEAYEGQLFTIQGRVITAQMKSEYYYQLLIKSENGMKRIINVKGSLDDPTDLIGKTAEVRGKVELPAGRRNPGLFDYRLYLKTKGIRVMLAAYPNQVVLLNGHFNIIAHSLAHLKYHFLNQLKEQMSSVTYGLMVGMLFGDRSFMSDEIYESFQKNGIAHILSVSGIHVGILYAYINKLFCGRRNLVFYLISSAFLVFYAALSEFSPSVVRSVVMIMIYMVSKLTYQRYDFTSCTAASALIMLLVNPFYLFNTGFQLSYLAVFCLTVIMPWSNRKIDWLAEHCKNEILIKLLRYLAPLLVIQIGMAPLTAYCFNYFSIVSFLLNIPIIAISGFIIPIGITLIPVSFLGGILFEVGAQAAELMVYGMIWLNDFFYLPGIGFVNLVSPSIGFIFLFYILIFLLSSEYLRILYQRKRFAAIAGICTAIMVTTVFVQITLDPDYYKAEMVFVDVGQGDCLFIRCPNGKSVLIDGGGSANYNVGKNTLLPYLLKNKIDQIDLALISHLHDDHYLGLAQLARNMEIKRFGTYEANRLREQEILRDTDLHHENMIYLTEGDRIKIDQNVFIDILYPPKHSDQEYEELLKSGEENSSSLILKITYKDMTALMTGDLGTEGEQQILTFYRDRLGILKSDILKIGHHGSKNSTSDDFLEAVDPKIAIFQVGKNNFGHPHRTVIEKCSKKGIMIFRNDLDGAVIFDEEEELWHIRTMLQKSTHSNG